MDSTMTVPEASELLTARAYVSRHHTRTPLLHSRALSDRYGCDVSLKCEHFAPIGSFKARGALYRLSRVDRSSRGVVTASTGNHGQGVAHAGTVLGVQTTVVVPDGTPTVKTQAIERLGAKLVYQGRDLAESATAAHAIAEDERLVYIEDGDDPWLMAGAGTVAWEILEDAPETDQIVVPVGGGNLLAGISLVARRLNPSVRLVGVQSEAAPAVYRSWKEGQILEIPSRTFAGGLATNFPGRLSFDVISRDVDEMTLVSEESIRRSVVDGLKETGHLIEGAAAAALAWLEQASLRPASKLVLVLTGRNIDSRELRELLNEYDA